MPTISSRLQVRTLLGFWNHTKIFCVLYSYVRYHSCLCFSIVVQQHMVMSFRVSELQMLLGTAGRNKSGRKHDLMSRALQLLKNGCSTVVSHYYVFVAIYNTVEPRSRSLIHSKVELVLQSEISL